MLWSCLLVCIWSIVVVFSDQKCTHWYSIIHLTYRWLFSQNTTAIHQLCIKQESNIERSSDKELVDHLTASLHNVLCSKVYIGTSVVKQFRSSQWIIEIAMQGNIKNKQWVYVKRPEVWCTFSPPLVKKDEGWQSWTLCETERGDRRVL